MIKLKEKLHHNFKFIDNYIRAVRSFRKEGFIRPLINLMEYEPGIKWNIFCLY